ncbi:MAG: DMT family transporter [Burkholderiales bacterium]|nr:DMT family transporter [Burkholderiales bacterium]
MSSLQARMGWSDRTVTLGIAGFFVLIWSTGFIIARLSMPYAPPLSFLFFRYVGACVVLLPLVVFQGVAWPKAEQWPKIGLAGLLLQAGYLGGVWVAIKLGLPAGISALVVGMQPLLTGILSGWFGEAVSRRQWFGLLAGFVGVGVTVSSKWSVDGIHWHNLIWIVGALFAITLGTLYQKYKCKPFDTRSGAFVQYLASALFTLPLAFWLEREAAWEINSSVVIAYVWAVLGLSIGAIALLFELIRRGNATRVSSLFYLTPPVTALMAWALFREALSLSAIAGMLIAVSAVALVNSKPRQLLKG